MKHTLFVIAILLTARNFSFSQTPQPIDLGIQNILQEQTCWCWAAAAQQVIYWSSGQNTSQCALVAYAKNADPNYCCAQPSACNVPGSMQDIQNLVARVGGHFSSISAPAYPDAIYNTLAQGKAIILFLQTTPYIGHFVVLRGMSWQQTNFGTIPVFFINDPMSYILQPITFQQLMTVWRAAIVVY